MLDALSVLYPQYWIEEGCKESFGKHLDTLKGFYCEVNSTKVGDGKKIFIPLLDCWELSFYQGMFKMAVKSNSKATILRPFDVNPLIRFVEDSEC